MDLVKKLFPVSMRAKDTNGLIVSILMYAIVFVALFLINKVVSIIPLIGWVVGVLSGVIDLYCVIGIIIAVLVFLKIVK